MESKLEKEHRLRVEELHQALGYAFDRWARLEHSLSISFAAAIRADLHVAVPVYFSASSFRAKYKMLNVATSYGMQKWSNDDVYCARASFSSAANKRAYKWSNARNKLAHERISHLQDNATGYVGGAVSPNFLRSDGQFDYLTTEQIRLSGDRFRALDVLVMNSQFASLVEEFEKFQHDLNALPKNNPYDDGPERNEQ